MDTIANTRQAPQQLSLAARIAGACAAVAVITGAAAFAGDASQHAVQNAEASINPTIRYIVLPNVEVLAKRQAHEVVDAVTCVAADTRT